MFYIDTQNTMNCRLPLSKNIPISEDIETDDSPNFRSCECEITKYDKQYERVRDKLYATILPKDVVDSNPKTRLRSRSLSVIGFIPPHMMPSVINGKWSLF